MMCHQVIYPIKVKAGGIAFMHSHIQSSHEIILIFLE